MQTIFDYLLLFGAIGASAAVSTILLLILRWQRNRHKGSHVKKSKVLTLPKIRGRGKETVEEPEPEIEVTKAGSDIPEFREKINNIVAVIGSRRYKNKKIMFQTLDDLFGERPKDNFVVITGDADGPDEWAVEWAKSRDFKWDVFEIQKGQSTFDRNGELAATARAIVAFVPRHLQKSGTKNTISQFRKMGKSLYLVYDEYGNKWDWEWKKGVAHKIH